MPMNVSQARWDYTGGYDDALAAQRQVGHCHRMSLVNVGSHQYPRYPDEKALERAVIKFVQALWCPRTLQQHEASITIAKIAQSFPPVHRVMAQRAPVPDLISVQPMSNPIGNLIYLDQQFTFKRTFSKRFCSLWLRMKRRFRS